MMASFLTHTSTGLAYPLDPERTLIGAAEHAEICLPNAPYLAALAVRYPTGWTLHPLTNNVPVTADGRQFRIGERIRLREGLAVEVGSDRLLFEADPDDPTPPAAEILTPVCYITVRSSDGMEEYRSADHDLLIGRLPACDLCYPQEKQLSRMNALLAIDGGEWYAINLAKGPIGQNRLRVDRRAWLDDGDELMIGPLVIRMTIQPPLAEPIAVDSGLPASPTSPSAPPSESAFTPSDIEARAREDCLLSHPPLAEQMAVDSGSLASPASPSAPLSESAFTPTDIEARTREDCLLSHEVGSLSHTALHASGMKLERWLRDHSPSCGKNGIFSTIKTFWDEAQVVTQARVLRNNDQFDESLSVLAAAIRDHPDSSAMLWELYRLYRVAGVIDLCYRPLRTVEKADKARGRKADPHLLKTLAEVCTELGRRNPEMFDRAVEYWSKLEAATGISTARERDGTLAQRAIVEGGYSEDQP